MILIRFGAVAIKLEDQEFIHNGVNIMRIPAWDAYAYDLHLIDLLSTKEELAISLLFKSSESDHDNPGLDQERVEKLLSLMDKRHGIPVGH